MGIPQEWDKGWMETSSGRVLREETNPAMSPSDSRKTLQIKRIYLERIVREWRKEPPSQVGSYLVVVESGARNIVVNRARSSF